KLKYLNAANDSRRKAATHYRALLSGIPGLLLPEELPYAHHNFHVYAIRAKDRDLLAAHLAERGISTGIHYPIPVHLQPAYAHLAHKRGDFPVSEACAESFLSLPMFPELTESQIERVAAELKNAQGKVSSELLGTR